MSNSEKVYIWKTKLLRESLVNKRLGNKSTLVYLLIALFGIFALSYPSFMPVVGSSTYEEGLMIDNIVGYIVPYVDFIAYFLLELMSLIYLYRRNVGSGTGGFIDKYFAIKIVLMIKWVVLFIVFFILLQIFLFILMYAGIIDSLMMTFYMVWWDILLASILNIGYVYRSIVHINYIFDKEKAS